MDETTLIIKAKEGDLDAFRQILEMYEQKIYNLSYYFTSNGQDASDLSQDTWVKALKQLKHFRLDCSLYTWLSKITRNTYIDVYRKKNRGLPVIPLIEEIDSKTDNFDPVEFLTNKYLNEEIHKALQQIPEDYKSAVILIDLQHMSYEEVSKIENVPIGTIRSRLSRGRDMIRKIVKLKGNY
ncbi:MAG: hypothetical protein A2252_03235 [Elusimicrobia bacterium RIFOXYA2_FULL_39_19]|nr:MAG: hypothetical protein A2252_03235 [Elusimicrobia bacterium RIFOXYA2_FULL_39_19]